MHLAVEPVHAARVAPYVTAASNSWHSAPRAIWLGSRFGCQNLAVVAQALRQVVAFHLILPAARCTIPAKSSRLALHLTSVWRLAWGRGCEGLSLLPCHKCNRRDRRNAI